MTNVLSRLQITTFGMREFEDQIRLRDNKLVLHPVEVDVKTIVQDCIQTASHYATERLIELDYENIEIQNSIKITIDEGRFSYLLTNLVARMIRVTKYGSTLKIFLKIILPHPTHAFVQLQMYSTS